MRIDAEGRGTAIAEMRDRPAIANGIRRGDEGESRDENLVVAMHAGEHQANLKGRCSVDDGDRMRDLAIVGELPLEPLHVFPGRRDPAGIQRLLDIFPFVTCELRLVQRDRPRLVVQDAFNRCERSFRVKSACPRRRNRGRLGCRDAHFSFLSPARSRDQHSGSDRRKASDRDSATLRSRSVKQ